MNPAFASLVAAGFDSVWLNQFVQKHGVEALELLLTLLRTGLTPQYLYRVGEWFGKLGLEILARYLGIDHGSNPLFGATLGQDHCDSSCEPHQPCPKALAADLRKLADSLGAA